MPKKTLDDYFHEQLIRDTGSGWTQNVTELDENTFMIDTVCNREQLLALGRAIFNFLGVNGV